MDKVYDLRAYVYDIETPKGAFLYIDKNLETGIYNIFRIDKYRNDLYALVKYLKDLRKVVDYLIGFNCNKFDGQVIQFILDNFERWFDLTGEQVAKIIWQFAQDVIDDTNHGLFPPYSEDFFWISHIDLFAIHHFDNKQRRCSLKWCEFSMDMENIEDMPYPHWEESFTEEMIEEMIGYCKNDNDATEALYWITRGITELEEYKGKDKIRDRLDIIEELKFPKRAMNFSDVKIGDELNKRSYCRRAKIDSKKLYDLKRDRKSTAGFTYGDCIPEYVEFQTHEFREFHESVKNMRVNLMEKQKFPFTYNGTTFVIAKGGIHSTEKKRRIIVGEDEQCEDADVGSQYPCALDKRGIYPSHLGPFWNEGYRENIEVRITFKEKGSNKQDPHWRKWKGLSDMYKLALNGGGFGKLNEKGSWQYDAFALYKCTIGNQFEILMLIEALSLRGIKVISANTDGIVCLFDKSLKKEYFETCKWWEIKVGNEKLGKLEFASYAKLIQTSVNDYIAIKESGEVKKKGDFLTSFELHKNKSKRIIPIALEKYFVDGTDVEETIRNHNSIWDFCVGVRGNDDYFYRAVDQVSGIEVDLPSRVIRYFVSKKGVKLLKMKKNGSEADGPDVSECESGNWLMTLYNKAVEKDVLKLDVDYDFYIEKAKEIIRGIENPRTRKSKKVYSNPNQISMF